MATHTHTPLSSGIVVAWIRTGECALCVLSQARSLGHVQAPEITASGSVSRQNALQYHNTLGKIVFFTQSYYREQLS